MLLRNEREARAFVAERCSPEAMERLEALVADLKRESATQNLISEASLESIWLRHIADSAQLLDHVPRETRLWLDLGTGAGFPGLVVAIMRPEQAVRLVESRRLRIQWLESAIERLRLKKCRVDGRDVRKVDAFKAAVITARAFAPLPRLIELSARFSTKATRWVLPKGRSAAQDIANLPADLQTRFHVKQSVTDPEAAIIVADGQFAVSQ